MNFPRQNHFLALALCTCALSLSAAVQANGGLAVPGQFSVSETGAATYTIPIEVPPGVAGMEPKLSLVYNSQSGNGHLGVGWSLQGLSAIARCPQTLAQDGVRGAVNYDANDRFCLDGQRLIAVSGAYGADGTEYRTERESFGKIISYGVAGNGPAWFKVWTKAGLVIEYGNSADSRIEAVKAPGASASWPLATVRAWAQNRAADTNGNFISVTYVEDGANGDFHPARLDYTGTIGAPGANSVQFVYESRPDVVPAYHAGSINKLTQRLTGIRTYTGTALTRDYRLAFDTAASAVRSRIKTVTICDATGACLPSTALNWTNRGDGSFTRTFYQAPYADPIWHANYGIGFAVDANGDGLTDLVQITYLYYDAHTVISNGSGSFSLAWKKITNSGPFWRVSYAQPIPGDFNGDGRTDFFQVAASYHQAQIVRANSDGSYFQVFRQDPNAGPIWSLSTGPSFVADVNGDGRSDVVQFSTNSYDGQVLLSNDSGGLTAVWHTPLNAGPFWRTSYAGSIQSGDFNGDGRADFIQIANDYHQAQVLLANSDGSYVQGFRQDPNAGPIWSGNYATSYAVDVNGDGKTDLVQVANGSYTAHVLLSNGDGSLSLAWSTAPDAGPFWRSTYAQMTAIDVNGDGLTDFVQIANDYYQAQVLVSKGDGSYVQAFYQAPDTLPFWKMANGPTYSGGVKGTGRSDIIQVTGPADQAQTLSPNGDTPDLLTSISNGLGVTTSLVYKLLTDHAVYTKEATAVYPRLDLVAPMHVVASATVNNSAGTTLTANYKYGGAQAELGTGRGFLGFRFVESTQVETGITTRTEYRQDWPYVGLPSLVKKTVPQGGNAGVVSQTTYTYGCEDFDATAGCQIAPGKRYFPFVSQSVEQGWDLGGTALPTVTTTNAFDCGATPTNCYGNLLNVTVGTGDGYSKSTTNTYFNDGSNWFLGRLLRSTVTSTTPGQ